MIKATFFGGFHEKSYKDTWESLGGDPKAAAETLGLPREPKDYKDFIEIRKKVTADEMKAREEKMVKSRKMLAEAEAAAK